MYSSGDFKGLGALLMTMAIFAAIGAVSLMGGGIWLMYWVLTHVSVVIS